MTTMSINGITLGVLAIFLMAIVASCNMLVEDAMNPSFQLLASEKTLPDDFWEVAPKDVLIRVAADQETLKKLWSYFGLKTKVPAPAWDKEIVMFLGTGESSNCPLEVKGVAFDDALGRLVVHLEQRKPTQGSACLMDFTPRTFSLALPRSLIDSGWREVQVKGVPGEPVLPVSFR